MTELDDMNKRRLIQRLRDDISKHLENYLFERADHDTAKHVNNTINDYLKELESKEALSDSKTESELVRIGWRKIYGKKFIFAWFCKQIIKLVKIPFTSNKIRWYHKLLMFKIYEDYVFYENSFTEDLKYEYDFNDEYHSIDLDKLHNYMRESDLSKYIDKIRTARFVLPHYIVNTTVSIQPTKPAEYVNIDFTLSNH